MKSPLDKSAMCHVAHHISHAFVASAFTFTITAAPVQAAYFLERGSGVAVCDGYRDHLNAASPKAPYVTERPIGESPKGFKSTRWTYVPDAKTFPADKVVEFFWERDANPALHLIYPQQWLDWRGTPAQIKQAKENFLQRVGREETGYASSVSFLMRRLDIDNDGKAEPVVRFSIDGLGKVLIILTPKGDDIDYEKSKLVLRHAEWGDKSVSVFRTSTNPAFKRSGLEPVEDALSRATYDVFTFQGKTYFDQWWLREPSEARSRPPSMNDWRLRIYQANHKRVAELCMLLFESDSK